jgi:putative phosphoribosyl transferase
MPFFADRADAGRQLAEALNAYANDARVVVLALPRGGVPVGYEVARRLRAPLDVYLVRKLGVPGHEELAMGALASDGTCVVDEDLIESLGIPSEAVDEVVAREVGELARRERVYRDARPQAEVTGKLVVIVDDGLATGATMRAAALSLRGRGPAAIVAAVPVAARRTCASLASVADRVVCVHTPEPFHAVGLYYHDFEQTDDDEVRRLLAQAAADTGRRISA